MIPIWRSFFNHILNTSVILWICWNCYSTVQVISLDLLFNSKGSAVVLQSGLPHDSSGTILGNKGVLHVKQHVCIHL